MQNDPLAPPLPSMAVPRPDQPSIAVVIPAYNEAGNLNLLIPALLDTLAALTPRFEIIIVDDGSTDATAATAAALAVRHAPVKCLLLSRNFGKESALTAGLHAASGDVVILMDADLQHPVAMIPVFFAKWREGYEMVYGVRSNRDDQGFWTRKLAHLFYQLLRHASRIPIQPDAGDFRLLDRQVVEALKTLPEHNRFMKGLYAWVGYRSVGLPFQVEKRKTGRSSFNLRGLSRLALAGTVAFTELPLRVSALLGLLISIISIIYAVFIAVRTALFGIDLPGWATLVVATTFLNGIQLLAIGILGEYVARIFNEVKGRPNYIVARRIGFADECGTPSA